MSKKIILLALAAASMAAFALPTTAAAAETDTALHVVPAPVGAKTIHGVGKAFLTNTVGSFGTVECAASSGTATFTSSTTGTLQQTFTGCKQLGANCTTSGQAAGTIKTLSLEFHLVTAVDTVNSKTGPGVLITPSGTEFAKFTCGFITTSVTGKGLVGTITKPACGEESTEATIEFSSSATGVQTHQTVASEEGATKKHTPTEYTLEAAGGPSSEDATGTLTLGSKAKLECT